jgi:hypothetical protein
MRCAASIKAVHNLCPSGVVAFVQAAGGLTSIHAVCGVRLGSAVASVHVAPDLHPGGAGVGPGILGRRVQSWRRASSVASRRKASSRRQPRDYSEATWHAAVAPLGRVARWKHLFNLVM